MISLGWAGIYVLEAILCENYKGHLELEAGIMLVKLKNI